MKSTSFNVWVRYFVWNFKGYLWNSTQNILPIHWKIPSLYNIEILRALRFKSSYAVFETPPDDIDLLAQGQFWLAPSHSGIMGLSHYVNTLRPRQNGRHFPDDILKWIFLNENVWILIKISLKFVPRGPINSIPALVQIMDWCQPGNKPLSEPMMVTLQMHICVTRPQWIKCVLCWRNFLKIGQFWPP